MPPDSSKQAPALVSRPDFSGVDPRLGEIAKAVREAGGRALFVGGQVRDRLLGRTSTDVDVEVFGLPLERVESILASFGRTRTVGRAFGVFRIDGLDADFSLPRRDNKTGPGHRGFAIEIAPGLDFATAARRRDFSINSIGYDPLTAEILDPHGGREDLARSLAFRGRPPEGPSRGAVRRPLRAGSRRRAPGSFRSLDLAELAPERMFAELRKHLLLGVRPRRRLRLPSRDGPRAVLPGDRGTHRRAPGSSLASRGRRMAPHHAGSRPGNGASSRRQGRRRIHVRGSLPRFRKAARDRTAPLSRP